MDARGTVVGVNTAVILPAQGICFAVGINTARTVAVEWLRHGRVRRGRIGISGQNVPLPPMAVRACGLEQPSGVLVLAVEEGSPADRADVLPGDVIVALANRSVGGIDDLHRILVQHPLDEPMTLAVLRGRERLELPVTPTDVLRSARPRP